MSACIIHGDMSFLKFSQRFIYLELAISFSPLELSFIRNRTILVGSIDISLSIADISK